MSQDLNEGISHARDQLPSRATARERPKPPRPARLPPPPAGVGTPFRRWQWMLRAHEQKRASLAKYAAGHEARLCTLKEQLAQGTGQRAELERLVTENEKALGHLQRHMAEHEEACRQLLSQAPLIVNFPEANADAEQILTRVLAQMRLAEQELANLLERTRSPVIEADLTQLYRASILVQDRLDEARGK